jgi:hypothetical protein
MGGFTNKQEIMEQYSWTFLKPSTFVECGSLNGNSSKAASELFENVYAIDALEACYNDTVENCKGISNITCVHGDAIEFVKTLPPATPTLWFLDAHFGSLGPAPQGYAPNSLMQLVQVLTDHLVGKHVIICDDVRLFDKAWDWQGISIKGIIQILSSKHLILGTRYFKDRLVVCTQSM